MAVSLWSLGLVAAGGVLAWSAVYDPPGGPVAVGRDLLSGRKPTSGPQKRTSIGSAIGAAAAAGVDALGQAGTSGFGSAKGQAVVDAAKAYIGVPYVFGGASRSGVDCSGLVLLAYKKVGINLPHLADAQMRRGRIIPRSAARPGDVVGWPSPALYSHIGILVDANHTIEARTTGTRVSIYPLGRLVNGDPTFVRILPE